MAQGKYADACPKFEKALALSTGVGTKFNLGDCYEKTGRPASALKLFREVEDTTRQVGQTERANAAKQRADALEPKVPSVTIVAPWLSAKPTATFSVDGKDVKAEDVEKPIRVDLGSHEAIARWGGKETRAQVQIEKEAETKRLVLDEPGYVQPAAPTPTPAATPIVAGTESAPGRTQRIIGFATGGAGAVALLVGGIVVLGAKGDYDNATKTCGTSCPHDATVTANDARDKANVGGIIFGIGAVALVTGVVLVLTAPSAKPPSSAAKLRIVPNVTPNAGSLGLGGSF